MDFSIWVPEILNVVKVLGLSETQVVDRTRSFNTQRELSKVLFLEDAITLVTLASGEAQATLLVHTRPEPSAEERSWITKHLYGGSVLGIGSLTLPRTLEPATKLRGAGRSYVASLIGLRMKPFYHIRALSHEDELPTLGERINQQIRLVGCVTSGDIAFKVTMAEQGFMAPEEALFESILSAHVATLVEGYGAEGVSLGHVCYRRLKLLEDLVKQATSLVGVAPFNKERLRAGLSELRAWPHDRVLSLLKKAAQKELLGPAYVKTKKKLKRDIADRKSTLESFLGLTTAQYCAWAQVPIAGFGVLISWLCGEAADEEDIASLLSVHESAVRYHSDQDLFSTLLNLYMALPVKPRDKLAHRVLSDQVAKVEEWVNRGVAPHTSAGGVAQLRLALSLGDKLSEEVREVLHADISRRLEDLSVACEGVVKARSENILYLAKFLGVCREFGLLG